MPTFRHIVLIKLRPEANEEVSISVLTKLRDLCAQAVGLKEWVVTKSLDTRKGIVIIENMLFESRTYFDTFKESAAHQEIGSYLKDIADWIVGDYES